MSGGRLQELEDRIAALEEASSPPTDQLQPNDLFIDPTTGKVYGVFSGGVVLREQNTAAGSPGGVIEWTDDGTPAGARRTLINGYFDGQNYHALLVANPSNQAGQPSFIDLVWGRAAGGGQLIVELADATELANFGAILDSRGGAIFPRMIPPGATLLRTQLLFGRFAAGATSPTGASSGGFTVSKVAVGQYKITFSQAFSDAGYSIVVSPDGLAGGNASATTSGQAGGTVQVNLDNPPGTLADIGWHFHAVGVY